MSLLRNSQELDVGGSEEMVKLGRSAEHKEGRDLMQTWQGNGYVPQKTLNER